VRRPSSPAIDEARAVLGQRLRELRIEANLTQGRLADLAGWPRTKVTKLEHARQPPSPKDIEAWCRITNAEDHARELTTSLHAVEGMWVEWRRALRSRGLKGVQDSYVPLWQETRQFRIYEVLVIPGIFQTEEYARARLTRFAAVTDQPSDIEPAVAARLARQRVLYEGDHTFAVILEESALYARVGTPDMLADQLGRLISVATMARVSLGIIPRGAERTVGASPGFWIYDNARVIVETPSAQLTVAQSREIEVYARTFTALSASAAYGRDARSLIADAIKTLGR
jgi:transcriptional regulator with XRE-family HTH domain